MESEKVATTFRAGIGLRWATAMQQVLDLITPKE